MIKKIICSFLIIILAMAYIMPLTPVFAESVSLYCKNHTDYYLKFSNGNCVRTAVVMYNNGTEEYPAYCLESIKEGIGDEGISNYEVDLKSISSFSDNTMNEGIWRIVTHGYPYMTPSQMGCESIDEAYMATKQAIYRYLAGQDETYYGGGGIGIAGERVYNAIAKLLDYGYNYDDKIIDANASMNKTKEFDFDNIDTNYYSATYVVSSNVMFQNYIVDIITDKIGIIVTDEKNIIKNKFNKGESFKILIPIDIVEHDFDIEVIAKLNCETKVAFYGQAPSSNLQSYIVTTNPYEEIIISDILNAKKIQGKGNLKIIKLDIDNKEIGIEGVKFNLYNKELNETFGPYITDKNGVVQIDNLKTGDYIIKEISTDTSYKLGSDVEITITNNQTKDVEIFNEHKKGRVRIIKIDSEKLVKLSDAIFEIYNKDNELIQIIKTDENGIALSELLPYGNYYFKEVYSGSKFYLLNENIYNFSIYNDSEIINKIVSNEPVKLKVNIDKKGSKEVQKDEDVDYSFYNIQNNSNISLDSLKWYEYIPTDFVRIQQMTTGTWNEELSYSVYYKTNKSVEDILYRNNLSTSENYNLNFSEIVLDDDEFITEVYFDFGKVKMNYHEIIKPTMKCKILSNIDNGQQFTNITKLIGKYEGKVVEDIGKCSTIVYNLGKKEMILPKTGI